MHFRGFISGTFFFCRWVLISRGHLLIVFVCLDSAFCCGVRARIAMPWCFRFSHVAFRVRFQVILRVVFFVMCFFFRWDWYVFGESPITVTVSSYQILFRDLFFVFVCIFNVVMSSCAFVLPGTVLRPHPAVTRLAVYSRLYLVVTVNSACVFWSPWIMWSPLPVWQFAGQSQRQILASCRVHVFFSEQVSQFHWWRRLR